MDQPDNQDSESSGRRMALKAAALAGLTGSTALLPDSWTKPILRTIFVPAHAQTTVVPE